MSKLARLAPGERARVVELDGDPDVVQRLLDLGLTEGEEIHVVRFAPMGDPMEIRLRGYHLSLRRADAESVLVEPLV